jgi:hypothetical protein
MPAENAAIAATYEALPAGNHLITVQIEGHGVANASHHSAPAGTQITLTATANAGYAFKEWQVTSGAITIVDDKFTMPDAAVTVKAVFEVEAAVTYLVTVTGGEGSGDFPEGATVTIVANVPEEGKSFDKWTTSDEGVTFADATATTTTFVMPAHAVTVTATYKDLPPDTYSITVQTDGHGTASASATSATAGTEITLSVTAGAGYIFKEWQITSGSITIASGKFTMPAGAVVIKAIFEAQQSNGNNNISGITIDGADAEHDGNIFSIVAACGASSVNVTVNTEEPQAKVIIDGIERTGPVNITLTDYGDKSVTIIVRAPNGTEKTYTLKVNKPVPFNTIVKVRWNNTLTVNNNPATNGIGEAFKEYKWYREGEEIPGATGQWWSAGANGEPLSATDRYSVVAVTQSGVQLRSCASAVKLLSMEVKAYPNPAVSGQSVYIEADVDDELLAGAVIEVYNMAGLRVDYIQAAGRLTPVSAVYASGVYTFVLKGGNGFRKELKVVVQ